MDGGFPPPETGLDLGGEQLRVAARDVNVVILTGEETIQGPSERIQDFDLIKKEMIIAWLRCYIFDIGSQLFGIDHVKIVLPFGFGGLFGEVIIQTVKMLIVVERKPYDEILLNPKREKLFVEEIVHRIGFAASARAVMTSIRELFFLLTSSFRYLSLLNSISRPLFEIFKVFGFLD